MSDDILATLRITATASGKFVDVRAVCSACGADFHTNIDLSAKGMALAALQDEVNELHDLWIVHVFTMHPDEWPHSTRRTNEVVPPSLY